MGNTNGNEKQPPEFSSNEPLRDTDQVVSHQNKLEPQQQPLQEGSNYNKYERRPSLIDKFRSSFKKKGSRNSNTLQRADGDLRPQASSSAGVTPQNPRKPPPGTSQASAGCSRSNSFVIPEEDDIPTGYQGLDHKQATLQVNLNKELLQKLNLQSLASQERIQAAAAAAAPQIEVHLPEEYCNPKDLIQDGEKFHSQLQISSSHAHVEGSGFNSLPNSLGRKSRPGTPVGSLPRKPNPSQGSELHSPFQHFNRISNESIRRKPRVNAGQPKLNTSGSISDTRESDPNRLHDISKMHRRRSSDKMVVDPRGHGHGQPQQQIQMNIARTEGVAIPKRPGASGGSPRGSPKGGNSLNQQLLHDTEVKNYYVAKDCWSGKGDLDVKQNEKLEFITTLEDGSWYMRSCVTGSKGTLPSYMLAPVDCIENQPWFFKSIGRRAAEEKLKLAGKHGTFLVRESESTPNDFSLSILDGDTVKHYRIRNHDTGGYFVELTNQFATLQDLVSFYSKEPRGLCSRLAIPCSKEIVSQERVIDEWELDRSSLEIGAVLGRGQYGIVREALLTIPGTNRKIKAAVKELKKGKNELLEFQKEVNALKTLRHERLIMLYGVCTASEPYFIVTEFLKNKSLLDYLKGPVGKYLSLDEMLHIALQVAEGMSYLESKNYVHRDLAARNVLLDDRLNSKIADFGMVSKSMKGFNHLGAADNPHEHERLPIKWTALEALADGKFTSKSDVWSFGVLLTEIITRGVTPYKDMDNSEVLEFLANGNRMLQAPEMDNTCYNITIVCWAKNPDNRPSFSELQVMLQNYIRVVKLQRNNNAFAPEYRG